MKPKCIIKTAMLVAAFYLGNAHAREVQNIPIKKLSNQSKQPNPSEFSNTCNAASQSADLDINNVRAKILNGGDMWWDLNNPKYEIPKVTDANTIRKNALYAGALWLGGLSKGDGNLKIAAMTYRTFGNDFFPGTLDLSNVSTEPGRCEAWDRIYKITREDLLLQEKSKNNELSENVLMWPAYGNNNNPVFSNQTTSLASFFDTNNNGIYEPFLGDYAILDESRDPLKNLPKDQPDQMLWYVYNDKGNIHSETGGIPIGVELQTTAFAFATNDEINNMTFYRTKIVNRGFETLEETYFGQWVDPDLGNYSDDYVGCDVGRSLGYCYNGDDNDEGVLGYGLNPPSIGVDFFEGPIDDNGKQLGMSTFIVYNNSNNNDGDPRTANEYYNYLKGTFRNGQPMTYLGKNTKYAFDDGTNPDPSFPKNWNERTARNLPGDRRFLQSAGPFTLLPGATQKVTVGVVWAKTTSGGATGSLNLLKVASDKAQKLFNNKFDLADGPEPPIVEIQELENELILKLLNTEATEKYKEEIKNEKNQIIDYRFQGYLIYQLKDGSVSNSDIENIEKARLVGQCDVIDNTSILINKEYDATVSADIPKLKVDGANKGIFHTLRLKEDAFATGSNKSLVDFKTYYYLVLAYGFPSNDLTKNEAIQYLPSRNTVKLIGIPHKTEPEFFGSKINSQYGDGPILKQISGRGNGGQILEFSKETIDEILKEGKSKNQEYIGGKGPVKIKIVDPLLVPNANFQFEFIEPANVKVEPKGRYLIQDSISARSYWKLTNLTSGDVVYSENTIEIKNETMEGREQIGGNIKKTKNLRDWGLAVEVQQVPTPLFNPYGELNNGLLGYEVKFADESKKWLTALMDNDQISNSPLNWIRSGTHNLNEDDVYSKDKGYEYDMNHNGIDALDPYENFEKIWDRRIAPYFMCSNVIETGTNGEKLYNLAWDKGSIDDNPFAELASVQLVITPDVRKWTKCVVLEMGEDKKTTEGNMEKFNMRYQFSKTPTHDGNGKLTGWITSSTDIGRSYFPGYAINLETGERLNIMFGEDSHLKDENGSDMLWNPTSNLFQGNTFTMGGKHTVYIMGSYAGLPNRSYYGPTYDEGLDYQKILTCKVDESPAQNEKRKVFSQAMWVIPAMTSSNQYHLDNGVPPSEVSMSIYMSKPYTKKNGEVSDEALPKYTFNTENVKNENSVETGKKSTSLINIVPNPYYAASGYESSSIDNKVKITNLPPKATISIYTLSGTLVRRIKKDDLLTWSDWDLKNDNRVPIASGFYIIHVDCGELGEKILKWYGVMRQLDLDTY